jgi:NADH-quinone oxidoreductase subunit N
VSAETISLLTPEIALAAVAVLIYLGGAFFDARDGWAWIALGGILLAALALFVSAPVDGSDGPIVVDRLAYCVRWLALGLGALCILLASRPLKTTGTPEYIGSLLLAVVGMMIVATAGDLVLLFLGLELVSIPTYIFLYLGRPEAPGQEATAKYFFLSILASAMLLYGFSFLYGAAGATDLAVIRDRLGEVAAGDPRGLIAMAKLSLVLIFAGLGFKIAAVPFHFYAPDVYQGTTNANAGLLSVVPKLAGLVALVRVVGIGMQAIDAHPWRIALAISVVTMTFGNLMALLQTNLRRLLAYSSIAHAGYLLIGLAVYSATGNPSGGSQPAGAFDGLGALLFYLLVYALATIGTFAAVTCLGREEGEVEQIEQLAGLGWTEGPKRRLLAWAIGLFMFSLAGIPPLAGFWGKLALFAGALGVGGDDPGLRFWFVGLAIIGVLNAAVAAAYYLRIVGVMFFRLPLGTPALRKQAGGVFSAVMLCALLVLAIGLFPKPCFRFTNAASPRNRSAQVAGTPSLPRDHFQRADATRPSLGTVSD